MSVIKRTYSKIKAVQRRNEVVEDAADDRIRRAARDGTRAVVDRTNSFGFVRLVSRGATFRVSRMERRPLSRKLRSRRRVVEIDVFVARDVRSRNLFMLCGVHWR